MTINKFTVAALAVACLAVGGASAQDAGPAPFDLPRDVVEAATAFQAYTTRAAVIGQFSGRDAVADGVRAGAAYQPAQLDEGMIAYGAIAALQDDAFVQGVQRAARDEGADALAERLLSAPYGATQIDGAVEAVGRIQAALSACGAPMVADGSQVKLSAYTIQHQAWSTTMVPDAAGRLAEVKQLSAERAAPSDADNVAMMRLLASESSPSMDTPPGAPTAVEARSLALAAEIALGHARNADLERLTPLMSEPRSAECLKMAKLNLYQCMAVAGPQYEDVFCLGQHAIMDTGACVQDAARGVAQTAVSTVSNVVGGALYLPLAAHRALRVDPEQ